MGDINRFFSAKNLNPEAKWETWKTNHTSQSTVDNYQLGIDIFLEHNQIDDLEELYQIYLEAQTRGQNDPLARYVIQDLVRDTVNHMINEGYSGNHAKCVKSGVTKFFRVLGFDDFRVNIKRGYSKANSSGGSDIIDPGNLRKVVELCNDLQKKALILTLKDSGLRLGDVLTLTVGDLEEALSSREDYFYIKRLTEKTDSRAQTVLGPEALEALRDWVKYRRQNDEPLTRDSPVFRPYKLRDQKKSTSAKVDPERNLEVKATMQLNDKSASTIVSRLFSKAGYPDVTAHGLRKVHSTYLSLGEDRVDETMIARMEGRDIGDSREAYKMYPAADLIESYKRNYHQIMTVPRESETVKELRAELQQTREKLAQFESWETRMRVLEDRIKQKLEE